ncbi:Hypothetical protein R9X50_00678800 [Acrodontium crateriforme]|uniref:Uncharacterized protein n=1 Tax=Acrodontium crateriforme TaxID=150365 RepID=A0AAQ3MAA7_9PEZI|nr:Hypothetical protein R9X50_00678800 [Acrodontium crateriforme]
MLLLPRNIWRSLISTPQSCAATAFVAFFLLAIQYFRVKAAHDPSSLFFDYRTAYERPYSEIRTKQADAFIAQAGNGPQPKASTNPSLCICAGGVQRYGARYFRTMIGSLLEGLSEKERSDILLVPFIGNVDPNDHQAYKEAWLHNVADHILIYSNETVSAEDQERLRGMENPGGHFEKGLFDWIFMLKGCMNSTADYYVLVEDDALAMDGWYSRTKAALKTIEDSPLYGNSIYLRLFYNTGLQGWNSEYWPYYVFWSVAFELFVLGIIYLLRSSKIKKANEFLTDRAVLVILFICAPACILLYFAAGRITIYSPSSGVYPMNHHACCSQAFVFPAEQVPPLVDFYNEKRVGYRDSLLEEYSDARDMTRWAITPSVVQHVGSKSSKEDAESHEPTDKYGRTVAQNIWNFQFEQWDAKELRREHLHPISEGE